MEPQKAGGGSRGGQVGYLEMSRSGSNTQMTVCRGLGCTYVHVMYVRFCGIKSNFKVDLDPWVHDPNIQSSFSPKVL